MLEIKLNENNLKDIEYNLESISKSLPKIVSNSINRTLEMTKTEQVRRTIEKYTINRKNLTTSIKMYKANNRNLEGKIQSIGEVIGLDHFKLAPKKRHYGKTVQVSVKKDGMKSLPNTFIAYHDGRLGAFERISGRSLPIKRLKGPSAPQMLGEMSIMDYLQGYTEDKFNMRFEHELGRVIK